MEMKDFPALSSNYAEKSDAIKPPIFKGHAGIPQETIQKYLSFQCRQCKETFKEYSTFVNHIALHENSYYGKLFINCFGRENYNFRKGFGVLKFSPIR